jgi:hypothetical protein
VKTRAENAGQKQDIKKANEHFKNVAQLKYLETTVTNQNLIQEKIKRRMNLSNAQYHSDHELCLLVCSRKK